VSKQPFNELNLAAHVGDDPEHVNANLATVSGLLGLPRNRVVTMGAVHGARIGFVSEPGHVEGVDALISTSSGLVLMALGADCATIALSGPGIIGVVHCGWRGLVADVVGSTVAQMQSVSSGPLEAVVGPAICGKCYPVSPARISELVSAVSPRVSAAAIASSRDGQPSIDIRAGICERLSELGVRMQVVGGCTVEDKALFSYRRDGVTGRQGMVIAFGAADGQE
jgi:YfiH family protein